MPSEIWKVIPEFPSYSVSTEGRILNNRRRRLVSTSKNNFGHVKVSLRDQNGNVFTRSVALLVAEAFVEAPDELCDNVILLDGNLQNVNVRNLALRPRWFAWKYARQLRIPQPRHYHEDLITNYTLGRRHRSAIEHGMEFGLLFADVWRSANGFHPVYPYGWLFEFEEGV